MTTAQLSPADKHEIVTLCGRAFEEDFSSLFHYVQAADHVLAYFDGCLVGHAVWSTRWLQPKGGGLLRTPHTPPLDRHALLTIEWCDGNPW